MTDAPLVSICTPTFNRAQYLDTLLKFLIEERPVRAEFELVICDNGSTDDTPEVVRRWASRHPRLVYRRQRENLGAVNNLLSAYRLASGKYAFYIADDDRLVPGVVDEMLAFMLANPSLVAAHAPWEVWWVLDKGPTNRFYEIERDAIFNRRSAPELFNLIIGRHIFPEICIYRTDAMQRMMSGPKRAYWAFVHLANVLEFGDVAFLARPYYRHTVVHPGMPARSMEGGRGVFDERDVYEAGLEYLGHRCLEYAHEGIAAVPEAQRAAVEVMVRAFMDVCLQAAIGQFQTPQSDLEACFEYLVRLAARGKLPAPMAEHFNNTQLPYACLHAFLHIFDALSMIDAVAIAGFDDPAPLIGRLREIRPGMTVRTLTASAPLAPEDAERTLTLAGDALRDEQLRALGCRQGLTIREADLLRRLRL